MSNSIVSVGAPRWGARRKKRQPLGRPTRSIDLLQIFAQSIHTCDGAPLRTSRSDVPLCNSHHFFLKCHAPLPLLRQTVHLCPMEERCLSFGDVSAASAPCLQGVILQRPPVAIRN